MSTAPSTQLIAGRTGVFASPGDDEQVKRMVAELIDELGFDPVDAGTLAEGRRKHQPGSPAYAGATPASSWEPVSALLTYIM